MSKHSLNPTVRALLATSALYMLAAPAQAADTSASSMLRGLDFSTVDANHDGYVDSKEASAVPDLTGIMRSGDKDRDGKLSPNEFRAAIDASSNADLPANPGRTAPGVGTGASTGGDK